MKPAHTHTPRVSFLLILAVIMTTWAPTAFSQGVQVVAMHSASSNGFMSSNLSSMAKANRTDHKSNHASVEILDGMQVNDYRPLAEALWNERAIQALADIKRVHHLYLENWGAMQDYAVLGVIEGPNNTQISIVEITYAQGNERFKMVWQRDTLLSMVKASSITMKVHPITGTTGFATN